MKAKLRALADYFGTHEKVAFLIAFIIINVISLICYAKNCVDLLKYAAFPAEYSDQVGGTYCIGYLLVIFSYKYGFISRGFLQTFIWLLYEAISKIIAIPINYIYFTMVIRFIGVFICNAIDFILLYKVYCKVKAKVGSKSYYLFVFCGLFLSIMITIFGFKLNDIPLFMLQLLALYLVLNDKEYLIGIPMFLSVLVHEGSVLMTIPFMIALVILKHRNDDAIHKRNSYITLILSGIPSLLLFFYFSKWQAFVNNPEIVTRMENDFMSILYPDGINETIAHFMVYPTRFARQVVLCENISKWNNLTNYNEYSYGAMFIAWVAMFLYFLTLLPIRNVVSKGFKKRLKDKTLFQKVELLFVEHIGFVALLPLIMFKEDMFRWSWFFWDYYFLIAVYGMLINHEFVFEVCDTVKNKVVQLFGSQGKVYYIFPVYYYISLIPVSSGGLVNSIWTFIYFYIMKVLSGTQFIHTVENIMRYVNSL